MRLPHTHTHKNKMYTQSFDSTNMQCAIMRPCPITGRPQREIAKCSLAHLRQVSRALPGAGALEVRIIAESRWFAALSIRARRYDRKAAKLRCNASNDAGFLNSISDLKMAGYWPK